MDCSESIEIESIPAAIDGVAVTAIGDSAYTYCKKLTELTIPDSVTSIAGSAFFGCTNLTSVTLSDSTAEIEKKRKQCIFNEIDRNRKGREVYDQSAKAHM